MRKLSLREMHVLFDIMQLLSGLAKYLHQSLKSAPPHPAPPPPVKKVKVAETTVLKVPNFVNLSKSIRTKGQII